MTTEGVEQLKEELYALPDDELVWEAKSLAHDFRGWLENRFGLSPEQSEYLDGVPARVLGLWGFQAAFALLGRGNLIVKLPPRKQTYRTKQTNFFVTGHANHDPGAPPSIEVEGNLDYVIP